MAEDTPRPEADPEHEAETEVSAGEQAGKEPDSEERLSALEAEVEQLKDQVLRAQAEAENTRRRAAREVENAHKFALEKFVADLLPLLDSLEKAVEVASGAQGSEAIAEGVQLSLKLALSTLEKAGVQQLDPLGEPFDPQHHEAMAMVDNPNAEPNTVMDVLQKGYTLNGRLVRAAMVVVVKPSA
jgi:molecular chaperone GrpE